MKIVYSNESQLSVESFIDVLRRSGLAERRPVTNPERVKRMLDGADLIVTARDKDNDDRLIGVSRCITDFAYCCYCSDLAVDAEYQGKGVGRELLDESRRRAGDECAFFLISAPGAVSYYERIDMPRIPNTFGWMLPRPD